MLFKNRRAAGRVLATQLAAYANEPNLLVLALPRGGVPVAFEIASALQAPLDVLGVRKLGVPGQEELAMGAIARLPGLGLLDTVRILNDMVVQHQNIPQSVIDQVADREQQELERRETLYRGDRPPLQVADQTVILVDDGLATGSTMRAAILALQQQHPAQLVVAVPVAAPETCQEIGALVDDMVCAETPHRLFSVGAYYENFSQTSDAEVQALLHQAHVSPTSGSVTG